jgi:hypothetical protein
LGERKIKKKKILFGLSLNKGSKSSKTQFKEPFGFMLFGILE